MPDAAALRVGQAAGRAYRGDEEHVRIPYRAIWTASVAAYASRPVEKIPAEGFNPAGLIRVLHMLGFVHNLLNESKS